MSLAIKLKPSLSANEARDLVDDLYEVRLKLKALKLQEEAAVERLKSLDSDTVEGILYVAHFVTEPQVRLNTTRLKATLDPESLAPFMDHISVRKCLISKKLA